MAGEAVGTLGDEAARLLAAAETWWREHTEAPPGEPDHPAAECRYCPVCQLISRVRSAQPEVVEHLTAAAGSLLRAVREAVDASPSTEPAPPRPAGFERIDIR